MSLVLNGTTGVSKVQDGSVTNTDLKRFISAEQTLSNAGLFTFAHGLGYAPFCVVLKLVCKVVDGGYSVGDIVQVHTGQQSSSVADSFGVSCKIDSTNITIRTGAALTSSVLIHATAGTGFNIVGTSWKFIVEAI